VIYVVALSLSGLVIAARKLPGIVSGIALDEVTLRDLGLFSLLSPFGVRIALPLVESIFIYDGDSTIFNGFFD
jgi:hypothetical protein